MALRLLLAPNIAINFPRKRSKKKVIKVSMLHNRQTPSSKDSKPSIPTFTSFIHNQVYEDKSIGIICYKDENGEIICEGFDEGPRYRIEKPELDENNQRQRELPVPSFLPRLSRYYLFDSSKDLDLIINTNLM